MGATVIVQAKIKDAEKLAEYSMAAGGTVAEHGGAFTLRAPVLENLTGNVDIDRFVMIEFPDADTARGWYQSAEYQALIPIRDEAAFMVFSLVETT